MSKPAAMVFSILAMVLAAWGAVAAGHPKIGMGVSCGWLLAWVPLLFFVRRSPGGSQ